MKEEEKLVQPSFRIQIQQNERMYVRVRETEHELPRSPSAFHYTVKIHSRPFSTSSIICALYKCASTVMINLLLNIYKGKMSQNVKVQKIQLIFSFAEGSGKLKNWNYATLLRTFCNLKVSLMIEQPKKKSCVLWLTHSYCACINTITEGKDGI